MDVLAVLNSIFPIFALLFSRFSGKTPYNFDRAIPNAIYIWIGIAIVTGIAGYETSQINDQVTTSSFLVLCWLYGNGYVLANSFSNPIIPFVYTSLLFIDSSILFERMHHFEKTAGRTAMLAPMIWSMFLIVVTISQIGQNKRVR